LNGCRDIGNFNPQRLISGTQQGIASSSVDTLATGLPHLDHLAEQWFSTQWFQDNNPKDQ